MRRESVTGEEFRDLIYRDSEQRLAEFAWRALKRGQSNKDFIVVAIDHDDPPWTALADHLMPNQDWGVHREAGEVPLARGAVSATVCEYLAMIAPDLASILLGPPPVGLTRAVVLAGGGVSIYYLIPVPEQIPTVD